MSDNINVVVSNDSVLAVGGRLNGTHVDVEFTPGLVHEIDGQFYVCRVINNELVLVLSSPIIEEYFASKVAFF